MSSPTPGRSWVRTALRTLWLIPLAALGFLLAANPHRAAAGGLPIPTITVPSLPVTLPTVPLLPTTTVGTPTAPSTAPVTTTGASSVASTAPTNHGAGTGVADTTGVVGARRLANGAVSIPVTSVTAPTRLVVVVSVQPRTILRARRPIKASVQVRDTRGYLVRGAAVAIGSVPIGKLVPVRQKRSAENGRVVFVLRLRSGKLRTGTFLLQVRASDPAASIPTAVSREIRIVVGVKR